MEKRNWIRTVYLYLFSLVGLVLLVIGGVRFVNMGLKAFVFTQADEEYRINYSQPMNVPKFAKELNLETEKKVKLELTESEVMELKLAIANNKDWEERRAKIDPVVSNRHRDAAINLSLIVVGLPLFLFHWFVIRKENKVV